VAYQDDLENARTYFNKAIPFAAVMFDSDVASVNN
jgi:hypothetical protein